MAGKGFGDADSQPPLYLRTTDEMLEEFEYLGSAKAREIVIENPVKIAGMVEKITPVRPDKCPPVIPDSDKMLRDICYNKAHSMYGEDLPEIVTERLERELNSIISNGFAVMYIIAQKLVWKSVADGYLVGPEVLSVHPLLPIWPVLQRLIPTGPLSVPEVTMWILIRTMSKVFRAVPAVIWKTGSARYAENR